MFFLLQYSVSRPVLKRLRHYTSFKPVVPRVGQSPLGLTKFFFRKNMSNPDLFHSFPGNSFIVHSFLRRQFFNKCFYFLRRKPFQRLVRKIFQVCQKHLLITVFTFLSASCSIKMFTVYCLPHHSVKLSTAVQCVYVNRCVSCEIYQAAM